MGVFLCVSPYVYFQCMYLYVSMCVISLFLWLCLHFCIFVLLCMYVFGECVVHMYICVSAPLYVYLSLHLRINLSLSMSPCMAVYICVCLLVHIYSQVCEHVYGPVYVFVSFSFSVSECISLSLCVCMFIYFLVSGVCMCK